MKREDVTKILPDISQDALDQLMSLHGADVNAIKGQLSTATADLATANQKLEGYDPEWQTKLQAAQNKANEAIGAYKRDAAIDAALAAAGARNNKAARAMLDLEKVTFADDKLSGLDEQMEALKKSDPWFFASGSGSSGTTHADTGGEHGQGGSGEQDGVEAAFRRLNPDLKI